MSEAIAAAAPSTNAPSQDDELTHEKGNGSGNLVTEPLSHVALNPIGSETLVFLHGMGSSRREWTSIVAHLSEYHILLPDLPGHSLSRLSGPFEVSNVVGLVAALISSHAHDKKCHLIGFSAGGYVALLLAERHPELLQSVFVSGVYDMARSKWGPLVGVAPYLQVPLTALQGMLPRSWSDHVTKKLGLTFPEGLHEDLQGNSSIKLQKQVFKLIAKYGAGKPIDVRVCAIAGGKQDDVEGVRTLGKVLAATPNAGKNKTVLLRGAMHWWGLQYPELFTEAVKKWVEEDRLPSSFEDLD